MAIWNILRPFDVYILWQFGTFCFRLVYLTHFGMLYHEKSGNPDERSFQAQNETFF
jgi:hypothetical protein